jgi:phytol kinase
VTARDWIALGLSFLYPLVLLAVAEGARRRLRWPPEFTRKLVHVGAGMWVFGAVALFDHWWAALIATTAFIGVNWLSARRSLLPAMDAARSEGLGTVWFMG